MDPLDEALGLLHFAFRNVVAEPDRLLSRRGLSRVHHRILFFVRHNPSLSVGELRNILGVSKQALNRPLRELIDGRLIAMRPVANDARRKQLTLTREGASFERQLSSLQGESFARAFAGAGRRAEAGWRAVMRALAGGAADGHDRRATPPGTAGDQGMADSA